MAGQGMPGCGWPGHGWLWLVEQWLVALVGRVIVGACGWPVKMVGCGSEGVGWQVGMIVAVKAVG